MRNPIRTVVPGLLLAFSAMSVCAQSQTPEAKPPATAAATQPLPPINLSLQPAPTQPSTPIDLNLHPAATQASFPISPALPPAVTTQASAPISPAPAPAAPGPGPGPGPGPENPILLTLHTATSSAEVQSVVRWIMESGDNSRLPFLLIDKVNAKVFVFNSTGQLLGAAPALLGMARGDRMLAPNSAPMSQMPPQVRITPAGRFVSKLAMDSLGKELLVLDYDASISLHAVVKGTPKERRAERLSSASAQDNRISFGCINVPGTFYSTIVSPAFTKTKGIVYVLPETSPAGELFGFNAVNAAVSAAPQGTPALNVQAASPQSVPAPAVPTPDAR